MKKVALLLAGLAIASSSVLTACSGTTTTETSPTPGAESPAASPAPAESPAASPAPAESPAASPAPAESPSPTASPTTSPQ